MSAWGLLTDANLVGRKTEAETHIAIRVWSCCPAIALTPSACRLPLDTEIYKWRHLIENFFCKLKEFKRIAMRADKTDQSFSAMIHLAAAVINSK